MWKAGETAPRDGTRVLGYWPDEEEGEDLYVIHWEDGMWWAGEYYFVDHDGPKLWAEIPPLKDRDDVESDG